MNKDLLTMHQQYFSSLERNQKKANAMEPEVH
jgi:hypothetical protein